jgi:hypothetical protein
MSSPSHDPPEMEELLAKEFFAKELLVIAEAT